MRPNRGLSLVEMLIVVAIIGILLALLTLGFNKVAYEADLAACAARLKGVAQGTAQYALDQRRRYPVPPGGRAYIPHLIGGSHPLFANSDLRRVVEGYIPFPILQCPLSPQFSLAYEDTDPDLSGQAFILGNYTFWMGWRFEPENRPPEEGMFRLGDRWGWGGSRYRVIASDLDAAWLTPGADTSHPDDRGVLTAQHHQNDGGATGSMWHVNEARRGLIDRNIAYDDAAVARLRALKDDDGRMTPVPHYNNANSFPDRWLNMPRN